MAQKMRMARMMEKSLTSFRSCSTADREAFTRAGRGPSPKQPQCGEPSVHPKNTAGLLTPVGKKRLLLKCLSAVQQRKVPPKSRKDRRVTSGT